MSAYHNTFNVLKQICQALDLSDIPTTSISVDHTSASAIGKFNYSNFANISLKSLSAGGNALVTQFMKIEGALRSRKAKQKKLSNLLLLIDEGDVFLHLSWQQKYIKYLNEYIDQLKEIGQFETIQVVLTTHSPVLMSDFPKDCIVKLEEKKADRLKKENQDIRNVFPEKDLIISFGAPLQTIINRTGDSGTIGEFAADFMKRLVKLARENNQLEPYHIGIIDDPVVKSYLEPSSKA